MRGDETLIQPPDKIGLVRYRLPSVFYIGRPIDNNMSAGLLLR